MWSSWYWHREREPTIDELNINSVQVEFFFNKQPAIATMLNIKEFAEDPASYRLQALVCFIVGSLVCVVAVCSCLGVLQKPTEEQEIELKRLDEVDPALKMLRERRNNLKVVKTMN